MSKFDRRDFIRASLFGGIAAAAIPSYAMEALAKSTSVAVDTTSRVSLVTGTDRADMAFRALQPFSKEIAQAVGNKRVIIKPNLVSSTKQLAATYRDSFEGILEFYKSINKLDNILVCESAADGPAMPAFENYGYIPIIEKYKAQMMDLDDGPSQEIWLFNELNMRPLSCKVSSLILDRSNNFIMSVARLKTHDRVVCTGTLKNIVVGAPVKDPGYGFGGRDRVAGTRNHKTSIHGNGFRAINYNIFNAAYTLGLYPDLGFIDGCEGMEGDGPINGTPVDHKVSVAGMDWLAVDRVCVELMGVDPNNIGYLTFCGDAGLGQWDLSKIEIIGETLANHKKSYNMSRNIEKQLEWLTPLKERADSLY